MFSVDNYHSSQTTVNSMLASLLNFMFIFLFFFLFGNMHDEASCSYKTNKQTKKPFLNHKNCFEIKYTITGMILIS